MINIGALAIYTAGGLFWAFLPFFIGLQIESGGLSQLQAGSLGSLYLVGFTFASVSALWWAPRLNWRYASGISAIMVIFGLYVLQKVNTFMIGALAVVLIGLAMGTMWSIAYRVFAATPNPDRSFAVGIGVSYIALALTVFFMGKYVIVAGGITGAAITLSLLVLLLSMCAFTLPSRLDPESRVEHISLIPPMSVAMALFGILTTSMGFAAIWAFGERIGASFGFENSVISPVISSNLIATALGSLAATILGARFERLTSIFIGLTIMVASMIILLALSSLWSYAVAIFSLGLGIGFVLPYQMATVVALDKDNQFVVLIAAAQGLGSVLGPASAGFVADLAGFKALIILGILTLLISAATFLGIRIRQRTLVLASH